MKYGSVSSWSMMFAIEASIIQRGTASVVNGGINVKEDFMLMQLVPPSHMYKAQV